MATAANTYSRAVNVLKPSKARMAAIHAEAKELNLMAKGAVVALIAKGHDVKTLYSVSCEERYEGESKLAKEIRVVLLGLVRRG